MAQARDGQVVTFYSFKGGTGRTMALANVAWLLASSGRRVLAVDWDLESPGLSRYFTPFLPAEAVRDLPGVIDLIREFDTEAGRRRRRGQPFDDIAAFAKLEPYTVSLKWPFASGGLDFMSSGRQNSDYATTIGALGWDAFYDKLGGGRLFAALRANMKANYDYTLIDSRTGYGDIADICVKDLPDTVVDCFTLNTQGIEGAVKVAQDLRKYPAQGTEKRIRVLPVPMRVDDGEKEKADTGRNLARKRFADLPTGFADERRRAYWNRVEIPYRPYYAYEETLAAFGDESAGPTTLLGAYERLTGYVTDGEFTSAPPIDTTLRESWLKRFERTTPSNVGQVLLDYGPEDDAWAEWIGRVLAAAGISSVGRVGEGDAARDQDGPVAPLILSIVSRSYRENSAHRSGSAGRDRAETGDRRAVHVSDLGPFGEFPSVASESLAGQSAQEAARRLTRLVGCDPVPEEALDGLRERYPDNAPKLNNALGRNPRFTGRVKLLRRLRDELRANHCTALLPANLPSGVGKTQLAREYVHRYKSEYEVIWWIDCTQPVFVDTDLADLGRSLNTDYDGRIPIDAGASAQDDAAAVAAALAQGSPVKRWLLVFDNAADPASIRRYMPNGPGHVLITSRNRAWDQAAPSSLEVGVFTREESIAHLRRLVPGIVEDDARSLADALGDLPVAVSLSGAWLGETGTPVPVYVSQLDKRGPMAIPEPLEEDALGGYSDRVLATFDNSLDSVAALSSAAHRLLELCSYMSEGGISLSLIYTPAMRDLLVAFDARLTEPGDIARHVQLLNRLALISLDNQSSQLSIHRLLHARIRQRMTAQEERQARHEVHTLLVLNRPRRGVDDPTTWPRYRMLWPHLDPSDAAGCNDERVRSLMIDRVRYMWTVGTWTETVAAARLIERRWQMMVDTAPADEDTLSMRTLLLRLQFNIANILRDQAAYDDSYDLDARVFREQRDRLGGEHPHTLMTAGSMAADLRALGKYADALKLAESTYHAWRSGYGDDHERTLDAANNLAVSLRLVGRFREARLLDQGTYERRESSERIGASHPRTIGSADSLGRDYRETGEYERSVDWLTEVLATARRQSEPDRRAIARIQVNLAASLRTVARYTEAEPILNEAFKTLKELFGREHPETLICRLCMAAARQAVEEFEEAHRELRDVITAYHRQLGPSHPLTLVSTSNQVALLRALGETEIALRMAADTAGQLRAVVGGNHPFTLAARMNHAVCLADAHLPEQARALDETTVPLLAELLGEYHPDTLRAKANLALDRVDLAERGAAHDLGTLIERLAEVVGRAHPSVMALQEGRRNHRVLDPQPF